MRKLLALFFAWTAASLVPAQTTNDMATLSDLSGTQVLVLRTGQVYEGRAAGVKEGSLTFIRTHAGGQAEYTFTSDEVERIDFPGGESKLAAEELLATGRTAEALPILEALYRQRGAYLGFLSEKDRAYFITLVETAREAGDPYLSVGVAKALLEYTSAPEVRNRLDDLVLLGHYNLPLKDDTRALAETWTTARPLYGDSALGWYILARLDYDAGEYESALTRALTPVTFSSQYPMAYLSHCYAVAILSAQALGEEAEARALAGEMLARHLGWPQDEGLAKLEPVYRELSAPAVPKDRETDSKR
ncbi:hypothetical protein H5P28_14930 [Ruficoccus amylovorans]|uniref:Tetratricopeptide repeat protein n=1 Tax=Ruficoccus amylovorans TaxID=1804625 RepID=A0A842HGX0_9BACT|nr:hypothetical protein [Ruficoccus amylovorans]MBC2595559.1 hypothetical protein [Ruficoccus amylovorans]